MYTPFSEPALFLIVAGPAGSGKSTLCDRLVKEGKGIERVVTCTTRSPRDGEVDGQDYHFFSNEEFDRLVADNAFLEWAQVHANRYGTLKSVVLGKLESEIDLVMNVDVQGVLNYQKAAEESPLIDERLVTVFIMPPSMDELRQRLRGRGQDDDEEIARRLKTAEWEVEQWEAFDHVIHSTSKKRDFEALLGIWQSRKQENL